jgi:hypothetical protein
VTRHPVKRKRSSADLLQERQRVFVSRLPSEVVAGLGMLREPYRRCLRSLGATVELRCCSAWGTKPAPEPEVQLLWSTSHPSNHAAPPLEELLKTAAHGPFGGIPIDPDTGAVQVWQVSLHARGFREYTPIAELAPDDGGARTIKNGLKGLEQALLGWARQYGLDTHWILDRALAELVGSTKDRPVPENRKRRPHSWSFDIALVNSAPPERSSGEASSETVRRRQLKNREPHRDLSWLIQYQVLKLTYATIAAEASVDPKSVGKAVRNAARELQIELRTRTVERPRR